MDCGSVNLNQTESFQAFNSQTLIYLPSPVFSSIWLTYFNQVVVYSFFISPPSVRAVHYSISHLTSPFLLHFSSPSFLIQVENDIHSVSRDKLWISKMDFKFRCYTQIQSSSSLQVAWDQKQINSLYYQLCCRISISNWEWMFDVHFFKEIKNPLKLNFIHWIEITTHRLQWESLIFIINR